MDGEPLQGLQQPPALLTCDIVGLPVGRDLGELQHHRHHQPGHQGPQDIVHVSVGVLPQLPKEPLVQLLLVQGGFQVDDAGILVLLIVPHVGAGAEYQGAGQAKVGEQQFPLLLENDLFLFVLNFQHHIFQGQSLHLGAKRLLRLQRDQRGLGRNNGMSQSLSHGVAVSGGAGCGVGRPAGGQNHRSGGIFAPLPYHGEGSILFGTDLQRTVLEDGNSAPLQGAE